MAMIRRAAEKDLNAIVELGLEFSAMSEQFHHITASRSKCEATVKTALVNTDWILLVLEEKDQIAGFILGVAAGLYFSDEIVMQQLAFYAKPGVGGLRLLKEFESQGRQMGIKKFIMGCKPLFSNLVPVYKRLGYHFIEGQYMKRTI